MSELIKYKTVEELDTIFLSIDDMAITALRMLRRDVLKSKRLDIDISSYLEIVTEKINSYE